MPRVFSDEYQKRPCIRVGNIKIHKEDGQGQLAKEKVRDQHVQAKTFQPFIQQQENDFLKEDRKILSEERITTGVNGKIFGGVQRTLQGTKGTVRQEVVYLGRTLGDPASYLPGEKERMLTEARRLLVDLVGQDQNN